MWTLTYETIGNHVVNPFPIDFNFPSSPVILTAIGIDQRNLFRKLGRLTFLKVVPNLGVTRGSNFVIFRGNQALRTSQLIGDDYQAEFYLYGYVPQVKIQVWQSDEVVDINRELEKFISQT